METDKARLLIVEDDDRLAQLLFDYLGVHGFELTRAATGTEGAEQILATQPDLVILDLMLPGIDGLEVCRRVRGRYPGPILLLTASQSEAHHVAGLELGADDFVTKPIEPIVLLARIRTLLRRLRGARGAPQSAVLDLHPLSLDLAAREVRVEERVVRLTAMEFGVLLMLARHAGTVVGRDSLYTEVLGIEYDGIDRGLDVHVSRVRRKLQDAGLDPSRLKSVRGAGYLLAVR